MKKSRNLRRAESFGGMMSKSYKHRKSESCQSTEFYTNTAGLQSTGRVPFLPQEANMPNADRYGESFYEDKVNNDTYYTPQTYTTTQTFTASNDKDGWSGPQDYAIISKQRRGSIGRHGSSQQTREPERRNRKDYQDVWTSNKDASRTKDYQDVWSSKGADRKDYKDVWMKGGKRREGSDPPTVPMRKYEEVKPQQTISQKNQADDSPPKLSAFLPQNAGKAVVRPIAFKPVVPAKASYPTSPQVESRSYDEGYSSQDSRSCSHNGTIASHESYTMHDSQPTCGESASTREHADIYHKTPSPSDSGVGEYEQLLREKENELITLRDTMEANERCILQVNEDNKRGWETQMKELAAEYHRRLRLQADRAQKVEQDLRSHVSRLQQDNRQLASERDALLSERNALRDQNQQLRFKSDDLNLKLSEKNKTSPDLTSSLHDQITALKAENLNFMNQIDDQSKLIKKQQFEKEDVRPASSPSIELNKLRELLKSSEAKMAADSERFEAERRQWGDEKKRVLQYQKQLQMNYISMCRRNSELEDSHTNPITSKSKSKNTPTNNNNLLSPPALKVDKNMFKMQLDSKPESLC